MGNNPDRLPALSAGQVEGGSPADKPSSGGTRSVCRDRSRSPVLRTDHLVDDSHVRRSVDTPNLGITAVRQHSIRDGSRFQLLERLRGVAGEPLQMRQCVAASDEAERHLVDVADQRDVETVSVAQE